MAWHMGFPLSQSLFTSLYINRLLWPEPKTLRDAHFDKDRGVEHRSRTRGAIHELLHTVLRAYCLGVIKTCDFVHRRITTELYYEVSVPKGRSHID